MCIGILKIVWCRSCAFFVFSCSCIQCVVMCALLLFWFRSTKLCYNNCESVFRDEYRTEGQTTHADWLFYGGSSLCFGHNVFTRYNSDCYCIVFISRKIMFKKINAYKQKFFTYLSVVELCIFFYCCYGCC